MSIVPTFDGSAVDPELETVLLCAKLQEAAKMATPRGPLRPTLQKGNRPLVPPLDRAAAIRVVAAAQQLQARYFDLIGDSLDDIKASIHPSAQASVQKEEECCG